MSSCLCVDSIVSFSVHSLFFFFFFFQAEDGIRDLTVTGVQTCALPIFRISDFHVWFDLSLPNPDEGAKGQTVEERDQIRSEERRVGKECRSRWSPYH